MEQTMWTCPKATSNHYDFMHFEGQSGLFKRNIGASAILIKNFSVKTVLNKIPLPQLNAV